MAQNACYFRYKNHGYVCLSVTFLRAMNHGFNYPGQSGELFRSFEILERVLNDRWGSLVDSGNSFYKMLPADEDYRFASIDVEQETRHEGLIQLTRFLNRIRIEEPAKEVNKFQDKIIRVV